MTRITSDEKRTTGLRACYFAFILLLIPIKYGTKCTKSFSQRILEASLPTSFPPQNGLKIQERVNKRFPISSLEETLTESAVECDIVETYQRDCVFGQDCVTGGEQ
ncbi:hypothetical protein AVEN_178488-1 [Araneus ventricosus]|uniref:Uncharacterized protein n=1 Tax=Araneus ventricosus TaxID=182803 RepID=A0A4Y2CFB0_ARAVE|nr:hypothetical protein AVEN_178488-1 [Araneus ventricosus]